MTVFSFAWPSFWKLLRLFESPAAHLAGGGSSWPASLKGGARSHMPPQKTSVGSRIAWRAEEDEQLVHAVKRYGAHSWATIAAALKTRSSGQCSDRWRTQLAPGINKESWRADEDEIILNAGQAMFGQWSKLARSLPGRSRHAVKNRFTSLMRRTGDGSAPSASDDASQSRPAASSTTSSQPESSEEHALTHSPLLAHADYAALDLDELSPLALCGMPPLLARAQLLGVQPPQAQAQPQAQVQAQTRSSEAPLDVSAAVLASAAWPLVPLAYPSWSGLSAVLARNATAPKAQLQQQPAYELGVPAAAHGLTHASAVPFALAPSAAGLHSWLSGACEPSAQLLAAASLKTRLTLAVRAPGPPSALSDIDEADLDALVQIVAAEQQMQWQTQQLVLQQLGARLGGFGAHTAAAASAAHAATTKASSAQYAAIERQLAMPSYAPLLGDWAANGAVVAVPLQLFPSRALDTPAGRVATGAQIA